MLPVIAALSVSGPIFAKPVPWALNFAAPGDFCMVGDVDGDGYADLIRVSPKGDAFIDVAINVQGMKCRQPQRANSNWGKDCQAACCGQFDDQPGVGIVGVFNGDTLRLAHAFKDGSFKDEQNWIRLPAKLQKPHIAASTGEILVWDETSGRAFRIDSRRHTVDPDKLPAGLVEGVTVDTSRPPDNFPPLVELIQKNGGILRGKRGRYTSLPGVKAKPHIAAAGGVLLADEVPANDERYATFPKSGLPDAPCTWVAGDVDHDGEQDLVQFRFGNEPHTGHDVLLYRAVPQHSGSSASGSAPAAPPNLDSSGDGILDEWKLNGFRGLDLKALGCLPGQRDLVCLISRFSNTNKEMVDNTFKNIEGYYLSLGWHLHPMFLDPLSEADQKLPWWQLRDKFLPAKWRGVAHWMAVSPYGGGQADELSDGGVCGGNNWSLYATFIHEFGHQLGLNHEGFWPTTGSPIYSSMMNYPYSYTFEGDIKKIHYSDGALKDYVLHETDLDETIPLPYDKVKFLADAPYHFHLKPNGNTTLIDWNWNGIFGEKHVRADINYAYSTHAGRRDNVGKTNGAPWTFTHGRSAYVLYALESTKPDGKSAPSVGPDKPGWLMLRRLIKPFQWADPVKVAGVVRPSPGQSDAPTLDGDGVTGDPVAIDFKGEVVVAYPSQKGLAVRWIRTDGDKIGHNEPTRVDDTDSVPSLGVYRGRLFLFEWSPKDHTVRYRSLNRGHKFGDLIDLDAAGTTASAVKSGEPVSMAIDTMHDQILIGTAEDQDASRTNRWAIRRERLKDQVLQPIPSKIGGADSDREWIGGEKGSARGSSRCVLLFDEKGVTGMKGRLVYYMLGSTSDKAPWACEYVAQSIADKSVGGGWMVKRYYDEWTQSRSGPAACWFEGDILYAYRWVDGGQGDGDNILHVGYNGTGIESAPMGDFDDIGFIRDFGMQNSILYLRE